MSGEVILIVSSDSKVGKTITRALRVLCGERAGYSLPAERRIIRHRYDVHVPEFCLISGGSAPSQWFTRARRLHEFVGRHRTAIAGRYRGFAVLHHERIKTFSWGVAAILVANSIWFLLTKGLPRLWALLPIFAFVLRLIGVDVADFGLWERQFDTSERGFRRRLLRRWSAVHGPNHCSVVLTPRLARACS